MAAELVGELERRKRAEADTREAQAALDVEVEGRRADQARAASLEEMKILSLAVGWMEAERDHLVSTLFQGSAEASVFLGKKDSSVCLSKSRSVYNEVDQMQRDGNREKMGRYASIGQPKFEETGGHQQQQQHSFSFYILHRPLGSVPWADHVLYSKSKWYCIPCARNLVPVYVSYGIYLAKY